MFLFVVLIFSQILDEIYTEKSVFTFELQKSSGMYKNYNPSFKKLRELEHLSTLTGDSTPIFGNSSSLNYYYVNLYIGQPPQRQSVIIDTGSHITAVPCQPHCINCGKHINPYYDMKKSNNSGLVECNTETCHQFKNSQCDGESSCTFSVVSKINCSLLIIIFNLFFRVIQKVLLFQEFL